MAGKAKSLIDFILLNAHHRLYLKKIYDDDTSQNP